MPTIPMESGKGRTTRRKTIIRTDPISMRDTGMGWANTSGSTPRKRRQAGQRVVEIKFVEKIEQSLVTQDSKDSNDV
jgi:hypothetical protein